MDASIDSQELAVNSEAVAIFQSVFSEGRDWDDALTTIEALLKPYASIENASYLSRANHAAVLHHLPGRRPEALASFEVLIHEIPAYLQVFYNYAAVLMDTQRQTDARTWFKRSSLLPRHPQMIEVYFDPHGY